MSHPNNPFHIEKYRQFTNEIREVGAMAEARGFIGKGRFIGLSRSVEVAGQDGEAAPAEAKLIVSVLPESDNTQLNVRLVSEELGSKYTDGIEPVGSVGTKSFDVRNGDVQGTTRFEGTAPQLVDATLGEIMGPEAARDGTVDYDEVGKLAAFTEDATEFAVQAPNGEIKTYPVGDLYRTPPAPQQQDQTPRAA